jgi:2-hydroxycyclohexanecarboxyl-CoA dehydrogenase
MTVAVVTGAARGLGSKVALRLAEAGQRVACVDVDQGAADRTAALINELGYRACGYGVDVTSAAAVTQLRDAIAEHLGPVRSVLNIAGVIHRGSVTKTDEATWRHVIDVNLTGPFLIINAFAEDLRRAEHGRIINCSSISAGTGYPFAAYAASKAGLSSLTRSALFDFWGTQVTVNAVCPGAMDTPMLDRDAAPRMSARTPNGRLTTDDDVAAVFGFLNSTAAQAVNGVTLTVDGGATAVFSYEL